MKVVKRCILAALGIVCFPLLAMDSQPSKMRTRSATKAVKSVEQELFNAIYAHDAQAFEQLLSKCPAHKINTITNKVGLNLLMAAAYSGSTNCVKLLIAQGADVNAADSDGDRPLHFATTASHLEVVQLLLANHASIHIKNSCNDTPLMNATIETCVPMVKMLLDHDADFTVENENGDTALIIAARKGLTSIVDLLLDAGADRNHMNRHGLTALDVAQTAHQKDIIEQLRGPKKRKLL